MSVYGGKVPKGTRNAKTGLPPGQSSAGMKPPKKGCALVLLGWAGAVTAVAAKLRGLA
jgi:hypothetical protein